MTSIRFELRKVRSPLWDYFIVRAKKYQSYSVSTQDGVEIHSLEVTSIEDARIVWEMTGEWRGILTYLNGRPISTRKFKRILWADEWDNVAKQAYEKSGWLPGNPNNMHYPCPGCHSVVTRSSPRCPKCGQDLRAIDAEVVESNTEVAPDDK